VERDRVQFARLEGPRGASWIVSPRFDLLWFVGGALAGYGMFLLHAALRVDMLAAWFVWFMLLDNPHFFGTYSRTYLDREQWRERRALLAGSLAWFFVPPAVLLLSFAMYRLGLDHYKSAIFALAAFVNLWAYWHVVRQHYGILALYQRKNRDLEPKDRRVDGALLYVGLLAPFAAFLVRHPETRQVVGLSAGTEMKWEPGIMAASAAAVAIVAAGFLLRQLQRLRSGLPANVPKILFLLAVVPLHVTICFSQAVLTAPLLGFAAFVTIFHDVQYHALVWFYQRNRYRGADPGRYGAAAWVGKSFLTFMLCAVAIGGATGFLACGLDIQPGCVPLIRTSHITLFAEVTWRDAFFGVFLGFLMHHYFLDQFIWRPSRDFGLRRDLNLSAA
jgi:hypothetical protein